MYNIRRAHALFLIVMHHTHFCVHNSRAITISFVEETSTKPFNTGPSKNACASRSCDRVPSKERTEYKESTDDLASDIATRSQEPQMSCVHVIGYDCGKSTLCMTCCPLGQVILWCSRSVCITSAFIWESSRRSNGRKFVGLGRFFPRMSRRHTCNHSCFAMHVCDNVLHVLGEEADETHIVKARGSSTYLAY